MSCARHFKANLKRRNPVVEDAAGFYFNGGR